MAVAKIAKALSTALSPFVGGSAKEISGYLADNIRFLRWKNAVRILERAEEFCARKNLSKKSIPIKFIVPFLEAASLEEETKNNTISDMWAALLANAVTSYQARHAVYVDVLKKLSSSDATYLRSLHKRLVKSDLHTDEGFDPDLWNVLDKQEIKENFQEAFQLRGKAILDRYRDEGFLGNEEHDTALIRECAEISTGRADFVPLAFDIGYFTEGEWTNGHSSPFEISTGSLECVSTLHTLGIFEKFECVAWYPRPRETGIWAVRATASFALITSMGFDFLRSCARP
jgi:Abortive infection alpha